jgi:hypothetical protein
VDVRLVVPARPDPAPTGPAAPGQPAAPVLPVLGSPLPLPHTGVELLAALLVAAVLLALGTLLAQAGRARRRPV